VPALRADQKKDPAPAPVPAEITSAKRVFIGNGGADARFKALGIRRAYDQFYSAMKDGGRYELVGSPTEADLVLEISFVSQLNRYGNDLMPVPLLRLVILDPKTHTTLWVFAEELEVSGLVGAHEEAKFDKAMDRLVADVKALMVEGQSGPPSGKP
jgi:hypothetical protein